MAVTLRWLGDGMRFAGGPENGIHMVVDGDGRTGLSPMQVFLTGLAGCTASDIIDIAAKMRVPIGAFDIRAEDTRRAEPPRHYTHLRLIYRLAGIAEPDRDKIRRAVALSHEKYCSALHSLRKDIEIVTEIEFDPA